MPLSPLFSICLGLHLATLSPSLACRARISLSSGTQICFNSRTWDELLHAPPSCFELQGEWKISSPLQNEWGKKIERHSFQVSSFTGADPSESWRKPLLWLERLRLKISNRLQEADTLGFARKLVLGESVGIDAELLRKLGFIHLLTATGIHIYALGAWVDYIFKKVGARWGVGVHPAHRLASVVGALTGCGAWLLNGARLGMLRPLLIVAMRKTAQKQGLRWQKASPLLLALFLEFCIGAARGTLSDPSRWYYALAVGGGLLALELPGTAHWNLAWGSWSLTALYEAFSKGWISLATPFLTLTTLPVFVGFIYPSLFIALAFPRLLNPLLLGANFILKFFLKIALFLPSYWVVSPASLELGLALSLLYVLLKRTRFGKCSLLLVIPLSLWMRHGPKVQTEVIQLDVGQGDGALVKGPLGAGLIDTGSIHALHEAQWLDLLGQADLNRIDWVALTHLDEDHSGGLKTLSTILPVGCVVTARAELQSARGLRYSQALIQNGVVPRDWSSPCVPYPTLAPLSSGAKKNNENMGAVLIPFPKGGFYLSAGDADSQDEIRIGKWVEEKNILGTPRILKVSHHGSRTSSNPLFLNKINPTEAWISVGVGNHYGHPAPETLEKLEELRIPIHRTDREGCSINYPKSPPSFFSIIFRR